MNSRCTVALIALATAAGWIALLVNMLPWVELDAADRVFVAVVAISGTASLAVLAASRPVREVYEMGRAAGQREAKIEDVTLDADLGDAAARGVLVEGQALAAHLGAQLLRQGIVPCVAFYGLTVRGHVLTVPHPGRSDNSHIRLDGGVGKELPKKI